MINATNSGNAKFLIPAGNYVARCYSMVHIGTVIEEVMGMEKSMNKVRITWELPTELKVFDEVKGEQPMVISKEYTLSMSEKSNLRKDLESWRGQGFSEEQAKGFDITKLLSIPCMLNVIHKKTIKGADYATISNISSVPKGLTCPKQVNPTFEWNFEDKWDEIALEEFPAFIKDKIKSSSEYKSLKSEIIDIPEHDVEPEQDNVPDDLLPF